jgi:hypothetical protein
MQRAYARPYSTSLHRQAALAAWLHYLELASAAWQPTETSAHQPSDPGGQSPERSQL